MLHIKATNVPFHLLHGSLICSKRLQSNRQKCGGILAEPGPPQKSIKNKLSVGPDYRFLYKPIALDVLYRVTVVVANLGWVDLIWDVPSSCLGSRQLQKRPTSQGTPEI